MNVTAANWQQRVSFIHFNRHVLIVKYVALALYAAWSRTFHTLDARPDASNAILAAGRLQISADSSSTLSTMT